MASSRFLRAVRVAARAVFLLALAAFMTLLLASAWRYAAEAPVSADAEPPVPAPAEAPEAAAGAQPDAPAAESGAPPPPPPASPDPDLAGLDPDSVRVRDFGPDDSGRDKWRGEDDELLAPAVVDPARGDSLAVPVEFPGTAAAWRGKRLPGQRFHEWAYTGLVNNGQLFDKPSVVTGRLEYSVWLPDDLPAGIRVQTRLALKNKDGLWYEALGRRLAEDGTWEPAVALRAGWNRVRVDLREDRAELEPRGHQQRWSRVMLGQIREMGLIVQGDRPYRGRVAFDDFATWNENDDFAEPMRLVDLRLPADGATRMDELRWTFRLNRPLLNPARQRELVADLVVTPMGAGADARPVRVPVYYDQPFRRLRGADGPGVPYAVAGAQLAPTVVTAEPDRYVPVGPAVLRAKWRPPAAGEYAWRIEVAYTSPVSGRREELATPTAVLAVGELAADADPHATKRRGYVRVSKRDPRYFEFGDGTFFFPVGHSFRSPADGRHVDSILRRSYPDAPHPANRGLRIYEELFPRLEAEGINVSEVWMATWWLDLEWTPAWPGYHHLQGYNFENAHKLDRLLDLARRHNQYLHLTLDNHGKATWGADTEWWLSPYRRPEPGSRQLNDGYYGAGGLYPAPAGLPTDPASWFRSDLAKELYRDKLRYVVARWGQDPAIFAWEIWSELDLTGNRDRDRNHYASDYMHEWHREMTAYLRSLDSTGRPMTTHYSGNHGVVDWKMAAQPFIDYVACDAYTDNQGDNLLSMLASTAQKVEALADTKPFMVTEYGGGAHGADAETLFAHFFAGMWWGWLSTSASTPFNWWYEWIILEDLYRHYGAFTRFIAGEDKRRAPDEPQLVADWPRRIVPTGGDHPGTVASMLLADGNVYYALVNNPRLLVQMPRRMEDRPRHPGALLRLGAVGPGPHTVECWNVWTGEVESRKENVRADADGVLDVEAPAFTGMIAVKVRAAEPRDAAAVARAEKRRPAAPAKTDDGETP